MRNRLLVCLLGIGLAFGSCSDDLDPTPPEDLLHKDVMVTTMYEMGLIEAAYRGRLHGDTLAQQKVEQRVAQLYQSQGITKEQFENSYKFYMNDPQRLVDMYTEILALYSAQLAQVEKEENPE